MNYTSTILITTKNRKDELRTALESCLQQQTNAPCEIFVINDGSDDGTAEMLAKEFPHVRVVGHSKSAGLVARRNEGTLAAKGDVVFSIDDDAEFTTQHVVEQTMKEFDDPRIGAVAIPFCNISQGDEVFQRSPGGSTLYVTHAFRGTAYAVRKDVFRRLGGYRPYFIHQGEEGDLCCRMFAHGFYVRLGSSDVINHFESPRRDFARMDIFGRRNDVLSTYLNTPFLPLPLHMLGTIAKGLVHGVRVRRFPNMVQGLWEGGKACAQYHRNRAPISMAAYRAYRRLKKQGVLDLDEISKDCDAWRMVRGGLRG